MDTPYRSDAGLVRTVLGPVVWPRTYANFLYLMLGFPIGLVYFVVYATGLSLGVGLLVIGIGLPILVGMLLAARGLARLERGLARTMLGVEIPVPMSAPGERVASWRDGWRRILTWLSDPATWRGLVFVAVVRFPLGLVSWLVAFVAATIAAALVAAPLVQALGGDVNLFWWEPTTPAGLVAVSAIGLLLVVIVAHIVNGIAWIWGRLAVMLLRPGPVRTSPDPELLPA